MRTNVTRTLGTVFGLVGLALLTVALFLVRSEIAFRSGAVRAAGKVVKLQPSRGRRGLVYTPVFSFTDEDGHAHQGTGRVASSPPAYERGEAVTVLYAPGHPESARLESFMETWFLPLILGGIGVIFASIGAGFLIALVRRGRMRTRLAATGLVVQARVERPYVDTSIRLNGRSPYRIPAQWQNPRDQKVYSFASEPIWFDPAPFVRGDTISVRIDADDPHQYDMDLSFLPETG